MMTQNNRDTPTKPGKDKGRRHPGCLALAGALAAAILLITVIGFVHNVPLSPTDEDVQAIRHLMDQDFRATLPKTYAGQIRYIREVQAAVAAHAPNRSQIPYGQSREPANFLKQRQGLCFDRSRTIEKTLRTAGFEVRHVALYNMPPTLSLPAKIWQLGTRRDLISHSITECRTARGWLAVDSLHPWISVTADGAPKSVRALTGGLSDNENDDPPPPPEPVYHAPFTPVYGLYSRHGQFYPPFTPIPDINWKEFGANFTRHL